MCCHLKPTGERRQATRGAGRLLGRLVGLGPSVGLDPGIRLGFKVCVACHLTYTRSRRCRHAPNRFAAYTNTCKRQSKPCSAPRVISVVRRRSLSLGLHCIHASLAHGADGPQDLASSAPGRSNPLRLKYHHTAGTSYIELGLAILTGI